jgi:hypothetical protein
MSLRSVSLALLVFGIGVAGAQTPPVDEKGLTVTTDAPPVHDATVGTLAGAAGTEGGAATYRIPIVVPPGRAGMEPSLALTYNSRGGDGVMGLGWSISGLSSIHRCPQTLEQDGQALGVNYTASDRLCLDGQRLVNVSGTYGAIGAQYRTEIDSYARITQTGGDLTSSTACFRVEQKDGRILHYGAVTNGSPLPSSCAASTANARVMPSGAAATLSWLVEKIEDRASNNQLYSYSDFGNGEILPSIISYTGYGAAAGDRSVTFAYQARSAAAANLTDVASSSYLAGGLTMQTKALLSVTTRVGTSAVRMVKPVYAASAYSGRMLVDSVQECAGLTMPCHPATQFESTSNESGAASGRYHLSTTTQLFLPAQLGRPVPVPDDAESAVRSPSDILSGEITGVTKQLRVIGDVDGDGARETAVGLIDASNQRHDYLVQFAPDRSVRQAVEIPRVLCYTWDCYGDFAGDGRAAVIVLPRNASETTLWFGVWALDRGAVVPAGTNPFQLFGSNIPFTYQSGPPSEMDPAGSASLHSADLNGDGLMDVLIEQATDSCGPPDSLGRKVGIFAYINNTQANPVTHSIDASHLPHFVLPSAPLYCLVRTVVSGTVLTANEHIDHVSDFDGNGLPDVFIADSSALNS